MFNNVDTKIKALAKGMLLISCVLGCIAAVALIERIGVISLVSIPIFFLIGWLSNLLVFAFGELCGEIKMLREKVSVLSDIMVKRFPDFIEHETNNFVDSNKEKQEELDEKFDEELFNELQREYNESDGEQI